MGGGGNSGRQQVGRGGWREKAEEEEGLGRLWGARVGRKYGKWSKARVRRQGKWGGRWLMDFFWTFLEIKIRGREGLL